MTNALTIFNQLRPHTIGYDSIFDHFNDMFESTNEILEEAKRNLVGDSDPNRMKMYKIK